MPEPFHLSDTQVEQLYCGYHSLNCALSLIKRKQELRSLVDGHQKAKGKSIVT